VAKHNGRHRAPGFSPLAELSQIAIDSSAPVARASAVAVVSGGLLAGMVVPAQAFTAPTYEAPSVPSTGPALDPVLGPVVTAPAAAAAPAFGTIGFTKKTVAVAAVTTSRATTRTAATAAAPAAAAKSAAAPAAAPAVANDGSIIGIAASLSGIPYRYGGTSTSGVDCSGFTQMIYRMAGISIPRTAEAQRAGSTKVANPSPGDLIFFGFPAYHAGIFAGGGMLYDAQHPGTVTGLHKIWTYSNVSYGRY
jgi:cell wall-associated NlpC family hydrolase